jgi:hypothetical protein
MAQGGLDTREEKMNGETTQTQTGDSAAVSHAERFAVEAANLRAAGLTPRVSDWLAPLLGELPDRQREIVLDFALKTKMDSGNYSFFLLLVCLKAESALNASVSEAGVSVGEISRSAADKIKDVAERLNGETRSILYEADRILAPFASAAGKPSQASERFTDEVIGMLDMRLSGWAGGLAKRVSAGAEACAEDALRREHREISKKICADIKTSIEGGVLKKMRETADRIERGRFASFLDRAAYASAGALIASTVIFAMHWLR